MTNLLSIAGLVLQFNRASDITNAVWQHYPVATNQAYFTNYGTNIVVSGWATHTVYVGSNLVRIYWPRPATNYLLQTSSNLVQWQDIRVLFAGPTAPTQWLVYPLDRAAFYRLRTQ